MLKKSLLFTSVFLTSTITNAADVANSNLQVNFEGAHIQGAGNQITMLKVPVTNKDTGETSFFDMSAVFAADKNGTLVFKNVSSVKSVAFGSANQLVAGHYAGSNGSSWYVDGPSVGANGRLSWSVVNGNAGFQFLSGPFKGNPLVYNHRDYSKMLKSASDLNYGSFGESIASAAQSGNMITVIRYSSSTPYRTYTLRPAPEPKPEE